MREWALVGGLCALACHKAGADVELSSPVMVHKAAHEVALLWPWPDKVCLTYWPEGEPGTSKSVCDFQTGTKQWRLTGLRAGTSYVYRIQAHARAMIDGGLQRGREHSFTTGAPLGESVQFAVMSDSHGKREILRPLLARIVQDRPHLDFLLHLGDAVNDGRVPDAWTTEFIEPAREFLATVPVHIVMGNHEYGVAPPFGFALASGDEPRAVNSFVHAGSFFLLLNSNLGLSPGSPQGKELERRLSSPEARAATWRFVAFHHPPFAAGWDACKGYRGETVIRDNLLPLLIRHKVDVVFNGHVHGYERGHWQGVTYVTSGGGGGDLDHACTPWPHIGVARYAHHVLNVDVAGAHLSATARALDGSVLDRFELAK